jgi:hypothetical protein
MKRQFTTDGETLRHVTSLASDVTSSGRQLGSHQKYFPAGDVFVCGRF